MAKKAEKIEVTERMYEVIRQPVMTEKAMKAAESNSIVFLVPENSTKTEIKTAVETVFKVKVEAVNTLRQEGKKKIFRGRRGQRSSYKKAIVRLKEGNTIDIAAGV